MNDLYTSLYISFLSNCMKLKMIGAFCYYKRRGDQYWFHINITDPRFRDFIVRYVARNDGQVY